MKYATPALEGALLDAAVAVAMGKRVYRPSAVSAWEGGGAAVELDDGSLMRFAPSIVWATGGPLIESERITIAPSVVDGLIVWTASGQSTGPTPLIAAMRALVAAKLGAEVDL